MLRQIKILDDGPNGNHWPGRVLEVDQARAAALVGGGHAEYLDGPAPSRSAPLETAAIGPPENTAARTGRASGRQTKR